MVAVLYEDRRGPRGDFGFHRFVCQCVLDHLPQFAANVYRAEKTIAAIVCKSNGNIHSKCQKELPNLAKRYRRIIALYDQDKLNELLKLKGPQCRSTLRTRLAEACEPKEALEIVFINANLESVIEMIRNSGLAESIDASCFQKALEKRLNARDSLFNQCANMPKDLRKRLLELLPDVSRLVAKIVEFSEASK